MGKHTEAPLAEPPHRELEQQRVLIAASGEGDHADATLGPHTLARGQYQLGKTHMELVRQALDCLACQHATNGALEQRRGPEFEAAFLTPILEQMFDKADPEWRTKSDIKWNFTKFLIDRQGRVVARFEPTDTAEQMLPKIKEAIANNQ